MEGALYCKECGTQFTSLREPTVVIPASIGDQVHHTTSADPDKVIPSTPQNASLSLYLIETGNVIPLEELTEFTLGRSSEDQPILPDIDLAPYHAYDYGVSRLHASIQLSQPCATLTDFGSANGTELNGQKMTPNKPYPITHGDIFSLGKMKIQVLVNR